MACVFCRDGLRDIRISKAHCEASSQQSWHPKEGKNWTFQDQEKGMGKKGKEDERISLAYSLRQKSLAASDSTALTNNLF